MAWAQIYKTFWAGVWKGVWSPGLELQAPRAPAFWGHHELSNTWRRSHPSNLAAQMDDLGDSEVRHEPPWVRYLTQVDPVAEEISLETRALEPPLVDAAVPTLYKENTEILRILDSTSIWCLQNTEFHPGTVNSCSCLRFTTIPDLHCSWINL